MTAFRIVNPFETYFDLTGKLAVGGLLHFYEAGTTTDADVYGDDGLSTNNGPTIAIGTDGRAVDDIWGDGTLSYRCRVYAADSTLIKDVDNLSLPGSGALTIPSLVSGDYLTNDGSVLLFAAIRQMLDPTGQSNKVVGSDGTNAIWVDKPADGDAGTNAAFTLASGSVKINGGSGDFLFVQWGTSTAPASGSENTTDSVTFGTTFKALHGVWITPTVGTLTGSGYGPVASLTAQSTSGFTSRFSTNGGDGAPNISVDCTYNWLAFGTLGS